MNRRNFLGSLALLSLGSRLEAFENFEVKDRLLRPKNLSPKKKGQLRIIFGSCNRADESQKHFDLFTKLDPDIFLWLGDCVYADTKDKKKLADSFKLLTENNDYKNFRRSVEIEGIWDDHDYGWNNSGSEYVLKEFSQQNYLDFLGAKATDHRRLQKGIYHSMVRNQAKIIMLDCRYHKTDKDMLGEEQWQWLEETLRQSHLEKNPLTIIASSITVIGPEYRGSEGWHNCPESKKKLFAILQLYPQNQLLVITGDKHFSAFTQTSIQGVDYTEFMASGMTHTTPFFLKPSLKNKYGKENCQFEKNFGLIDLDYTNNQAQLCSMTMEGKIALSRSLKL